MISFISFISLIYICIITSVYGHRIRQGDDIFDELSEALAFFQGAYPKSYIVNLTLPISNTERTKYITKGSVSITFQWVSVSEGILQLPRNVIALHSKFIKIDQNSIRFWYIQSSDQLTGVPIRAMTIREDDEIILIRLNPRDHLKNGTIYRLDIYDFESLIENDGSKNAVFLTSPGLSTQFQLNDARRAFPCLDMPNKKATFKFHITHPSDYIAIFNTDMDIGASNTQSDGWTKTSFLPTPIMSTYILAFALVPKIHVERGSLNTESNDGIRISVFSNPERLIHPQLVPSLLKYATEAYEILRRIFTIQLPVTKFDVCVVKGLSILGMENWGLINLREEFILKENEIEQFGLVAHEFAHQWIGNLATTTDWRHLCVQEGLTEHYARRVLAEFYGGTRSWQYQRYLFVRYLSSIHNETHNVHLKPIRQDFQGFDQAVAFCFGRVPFVWTMLERVVGGAEKFDTMINGFLADYAYKNFILDDLLSYFNKIYKAADILEYYVDHGGYASLFVRRINESTYRLNQRQIAPLINTGTSMDDTESSYEVPSTKHIWPIPLSTNKGQQLMLTNEYDLPVYNMPSDTHGVPLLNPDFIYFYRINYQMDIWNNVITSLLSFPNAYTEMTKIQFLNDFCFFRSLDLIETKDKTSLDRLTKQFIILRNQLEISTNMYIRFYIRCET